MTALEQILSERILLSKPNLGLLDTSFPNQRNFIKDPSRLKALFCTRRASKTYTAGLYLVKESLENPGVSSLFIGLTRLSAKGIVWKDVLKDINKKHDLRIAFNETLLTATFPNGSVIYVTGVDADQDEMEKLLGQKYRLVCIDEAASYSIDLNKLVYGVLKPATIDQGGTICLMGTSGNIVKGLFFDITTSKEAGWSLHSWTAMDNPFIRDQWIEELEDIRKNRPLFMETPLFRQWYLNEWVIDTDKLVYKFDRLKNTYGTMPREYLAKWNYVLGVDLGYEDATAFVLTAFNDNDPTLYIVETFKKSKMDITDVANRIKAFQTQHDIYKVIVDGANKQAVEEIRKRHGIALDAADKTGKSDFIEIMNAEFIQAKIKINPATSSDLIDEYLGLIWDERALGLGKRVEHSSCDNHLCDAALYAWRYCYQFLSTAAKEPVRLNTQEAWVKHTTKLMEESLEHQISQEQAKEHGEDMFNLTYADTQEDVMSYYINKRRQ